MTKALWPVWALVGEMQAALHFDGVQRHVGKVVMLGVHRQFVTLTVQALSAKVLSPAGRQIIKIVNRNGLVKMSNGAYPPPD
jgi:hypothetical protein